MPWSAQIHTGFPVPRTTWDASRASLDFAYRTITVYGAFFQTLLLSFNDPTLRSRNPLMQASRFSLFPLRSPLLGESHAFSFPVATKMFQFATFASRTYSFSTGLSGVNPTGLPHSEISGSKLICSSPELIAAYRVLHRLSLPSQPS